MPSKNENDAHCLQQWQKTQKGNNAFASWIIITTTLWTAAAAGVTITIAFHNASNSSDSDKEQKNKLELVNPEEFSNLHPEIKP